MFHNVRHYRRTDGTVYGLELLKPLHEYGFHANSTINFGPRTTFSTSTTSSAYGSLFNISSLTSSSSTSTVSSTVLHARMYNKNQYLHAPTTHSGTLSAAGTNQSSSSQGGGASVAHGFRYKLSNASWKVWNHYARELLPSLRRGDGGVVDSGEDSG
ncbi:hypothetical protein DL771_008595 [Monosporascus sp. 5C6A]|nr:hypothetical protein DL771_008595 [Monosporascus sp. 5C6A]